MITFETLFAIVLLVVAVVILVLLAWWRFERRDIRVGGEGGWGLPVLSRRKSARASGEP